jgi:hypothetical protein
VLQYFPDVKPFAFATVVFMSFVASSIAAPLAAANAEAVPEPQPNPVPGYSAEYVFPTSLNVDRFG